MNMTGEEDYVYELGESEQVSRAVLRAIAAVSNQPLLELPPLQESLDTDSLDQLFASSTTVGSLQFTYAGYDVTVEPERIRIRERG